MACEAKRLEAVGVGRRHGDPPPVERSAWQRSARVDKEDSLVARRTVLRERARGAVWAGVRCGTWVRVCDFLVTTDEVITVWCPVGAVK